MIDLHTHSTCSDGSDSPSEIIRKAHEIGLTAIALTDHDVVDGLEEFQAAARQFPDLWAINGSELAVSHPQADIEILALDIKDIAAFKKRQEMLVKIRDDANAERAELLRKVGVEVDLEEIYTDKNGCRRKLVGRPHFAEYLMKKGYVATFQEAFEKYIGNNCPAYIPKRNPPLRDTIEFIAGHNAVPSLAHPIHTKVDDETLLALLKEMKGYGLQGMECYHSDHSPEQIQKYLGMAKKVGLFSTGGSDYHGRAHPDVKLGIGKGTLNIPDELLAPFFARKA